MTTAVPSVMFNARLLHFRRARPCAGLSGRRGGAAKRKPAQGDRAGLSGKHNGVEQSVG